MKIASLKEELTQNAYPGRGIIAGLSKDGKYAVSAYWTMGRSAGSRNRIFVKELEDGSEVIRTKAFDPSLIAGDPSLIIYAAVRKLGSKTIVTNGDQTDTIFEGLKNGLSFEQSLRSRKYEHDAPNYTPRISSLLDIEGGKYNYSISILKSENGNPLPSNVGDPTPVEIEGDIKTFADNLWSWLNADNKVSLFVRFIEIATGKEETVVINKNN